MPIMAEDDKGAPPANPINEVDPMGPNPPEARTPTGDANEAATTYAAQAEQGKGTQDPFPYDPTNELLDGDDSPSVDELAARGVRVSDSGRALVPLDDPTGVMSIPPPNANLEIAKGREKLAVAADEADGLDPDIGREARRGALRAAGRARMAASGTPSGADATPPPEARSKPPQGRKPGPAKATS